MNFIQVFNTECDGMWGGNLGMGRKEELEKVMLDYIKLLFRLEFCTPRYIITRELRMIKLKIR